MGLMRRKQPTPQPRNVGNIDISGEIRRKSVTGGRLIGRAWLTDRQLDRMWLE